MKKKKLLYNLLKHFFECKGLIWQHIESFNYFLNTELKKIVFSECKKNSKNIKNFNLKFSNLKISCPSDYVNYMEVPITPNQCRITDSSYHALIFLDLYYEIKEKKYYSYNFNLCRFPIMLQSNKCVLFGKTENQLLSMRECSLDPGGYFIIKGTEKVILIQEQILLNRIYIEQDQQGFICAHVNSSGLKMKIKNTIIFKNRKLYFKNKIFIEDIPVIILLKSMGMELDRDILDLLGVEFSDILEWSILEAKVSGITSSRQAIHYVMQRFNSKIIREKETNNLYKKKDIQNEKKFFSYIIDKNILAHLSIKNNSKTLEEKTIFISLMVRRIFLTFNQSFIQDNKDYFGNKRLDLAGELVSLLFEDLFQKTVKETQKFVRLNQEKVNKNILDFSGLMRQDIITNGLDYSFSTGNWIIKKFKSEKNGVTQTLSRLSFISSISNVTKITSQNEKIRKIRGPRSLYTSQWGMICPTDTPEGESCGLVKDLALLAHLTTKSKTKFIFKLCENLGIRTHIIFREVYLKSAKNFSKIFLDGKFIGFHENSPDFLFVFRTLRRSGMLNYYISIYWDPYFDEIHISTDSGRICRPFLIVQFGKVKFRNFKKNINSTGFYFFKDLLRQGLVEFLDVNEQNNARISCHEDDISQKTTHLEISPEIILGICASLIPFLDHNQSPRNTYQCSMGKQSVGHLSFNQNYRFDTMLSLLIYPQKPLVKTKVVYLSGNYLLSSGINACICILSYSGFDLEDSIILNRASEERGFFRSIMLRKHKILLKNSIFEKNSESNKHEIREANNRIMQKESQFNKYFHEKKDMAYFLEKQLISRLSSKEINGDIIEKIIFSSNLSEVFFAKIILRHIRRPEVGDKFSSRHGQKGICGALCFQKDFPFSNEGMTPDLIMNPHGFPSRMTIGKIVELIGAKIGSISGKFLDGTPFLKSKKIHFEKRLKNLGFSSKGKDIYFSGITGEPMLMEVFSGPVYYQKLKHMVKDKIHARAKGPRSNITRQPVEGRIKGGGLRFGEMERDCLVSYGASETIIERLLISSDIFVANFDFLTGFFNEKKNKKNIFSIKMPYACKLLFQELQSMNILPRLMFSPKFSGKNIIFRK